MKHILLITTGGTIASAESEDGLLPTLASEQLLEHVPEISNICRVSTVELYNLDSTNMRPEFWLEIARYIRKVYDDYDGFVITHGTDTMAYAAAMLYYLIQNNKKPIVLTGAQIPIEKRDTDARENLADAFRYATDDGACGVHIIFGDKIIAARCTLPITEKTNISARYGLRHKAAIGITEETDADAIVVSEESGNISFVKGGVVTPINNINELKLLLGAAMGEE